MNGQWVVVPWILFKVQIHFNNRYIDNYEATVKNNENIPPLFPLWVVHIGSHSYKLFWLPDFFNTLQNYTVELSWAYFFKQINYAKLLAIHDVNQIFILNINICIINKQYINCIKDTLFVSNKLIWNMDFSTCNFMITCTHPLYSWRKSNFYFKY
jgi:hypothetical protein